jgi:outer membrane lipoprotein-sorting protein
MLRKKILSSLALCFCLPLVGSGQDNQTAAVNLSAAQIVERNVAARGGLEAWRAIQSMSWTGRVQAGGKQNTELPFAFEMKRPLKSRLEVPFQGQTAIQVYDGSQGWKLRPFLGRLEIEPYTAEEMKSASVQSDLDGPLVDYATKGTKVELEGTERVEGRDSYKLKLTLKSGDEQRIWVDAETFLEVKQEGTPRRLDGKMHAVAVFYRDYKSVGGVMLPYLIETVVDGVTQTHKMTIDKVAVNPKLEDSIFTRPTVAAALGPQKNPARMVETANR